MILISKKASMVQAILVGVRPCDLNTLKSARGRSGSKASIDVELSLYGIFSVSMSGSPSILSSSGCALLSRLVFGEQMPR